MGNTNISKESDLTLSLNILEDYTPKKKITDQRYGEATLMQHKLSKELVIMKEITTNNFKDYLSTIVKWENRLKMKHPNLIQLVGLCKKEESQYCSKFYKIFLLFEYIKNDLEEQTTTKISDKQNYTEDELWFILYCILNALFFYQKNNVFHGDLKSSTIFISQNSTYKIVDHTLFNNASCYMQVQWNPQKSHSGIYLSPELLKSLSKDLVQPLHNAYKSDIYSLGMIILHIALLENCDDCYDYENFKLKSDVLSAKLNSLKKKYSEKLCNFLKNMLSEQEFSRPDYEELLTKIHIPENLKKEDRMKQIFASETYNFNKNEYKLDRPLNQSNSNILPNNIKNEIISVESIDDIQTDFLKKRGDDEEKEKSFFSESKSLNVQDPSQKLEIQDEYLKLILIKEGRLEDTFSKSKKNVSISISDNLTPNILKHSNKPNLITPVFKENQIKSNFEKKYVSESYSNGSKYEGEKINEKRHGKGTFFYADGGYYEGEWKENLMNGQGSLYYPSGSLAYTGYWANDKFHGYGELHNDLPNTIIDNIDYKNLNLVGENWTKYEGDFRSDNKEGYGVLYFTNEEKYVGEFKFDLANGQGNFYTRNGQIISGVWRNNLFIEN